MLVDWALNSTPPPLAQYAWLANATDPSLSHFMIGYAGSQGDGGVPSSWPLLYNALWLRLFGLDNLLPNQTGLLAQMGAFYENAVMLEYGVPLNRRGPPGGEGGGSDGW